MTEQEVKIALLERVERLSSIAEGRIINKSSTSVATGSSFADDVYSISELIKAIGVVTKSLSSSPSDSTE